MTLCVKCKASIEICTVGIVFVVRCEQLAIVFSFVFGQGYIRNPDIEPVAFFQLKIPQKQLAITVFVEYRDLNGVSTIRQNFLHDKPAIVIYGNFQASHPDVMPFRNRTALRRDSPTSDRDVLPGKASLAVSGQELLLRVYLS